MNVDELLKQHAIDGRCLDPAPPETGDRLTDDPRGRARYRADAWRPCCVCGTDCRTSRVIDFPGCGPRWVDLCRDHSLAVSKPALPTMPTTVEGGIRGHQGGRGQVRAHHAARQPLGTRG